MVRRWGRSRVWMVLQVLVLVLGARAAWADDFDVICSGGTDPGHSATNYSSIKAALNAARSVSPDGPHTIWVSGDCTEVLYISGFDELTIQGTPATPGTPDDSLTGDGLLTGGAPSVIQVTRSTSVRLHDMRVVGIPSRNNVIQFAVAGGSIQRSIIESGTLIGVSIVDNSSVNIRDCRIVNNAGNGVSVGNLSSVSFGGTMEITGNAGHGISLGGSSLMSGGASSGQISGNQGRGIDLQNSTIQFGGSLASPLQIFDNGRQGVFLFGARGNVTNLAISHNNLLGPQAPADPGPIPGFFQCGLCLHGGTDLFINGVQITESMFGAHGMVLRAKSGAHLRNMTITGNAADGIYLEAASGVLFLTGTTNVSGNGGSGANCIDPHSWIAGDLTGVAKLKCK